MVGLKFFHKYIIILSGKELLNKVCSREEFNARPDSFTSRLRTFGKRQGIIITDGPQWENQRMFSTRTLKRFGVGKYSMVKHIEDEAEKLVNFLFKKSDTAECVQINSVFDISALNLIWVLLAGEKFELDDQQLIDLVADVHKYSQNLEPTGGILDMFPAIRHVMPVRSGYQKHLETLAPISKFLMNKIQEIKVNYDPSENPKSFIEAYLQEMSHQSSKYFTDEQLFGVCLDFFQAGSDTTSNTLGFAMLYMLHYPEVMHRVQQELRSFVGAEKLPKLSDRSSLKYTDAVVHEVQRCSNVAPFGVAHCAKSQTHLNGYLIPKDSIILCNFYGIHMDENYWENPAEFRPERFLNEDGELRLSENFVPYGKFLKFEQFTYK